MSPLQEFLAALGPPEFRPVPYFNETGQMIHWYFKDDPSYSEPVHHGGKWVGSVHKSMETGEVTGVNIHLESVMGLGSWEGFDG